LFFCQTVVLNVIKKNGHIDFDFDIAGNYTHNKSKIKNLKSKIEKLNYL